MLLNNKDTIKKGFTFLSSDPVMDFFIKEFGNQIDPLDRHNNNYAIALSNLIIEQQISFKAAITIKKKFDDLTKILSNREILEIDNKIIQSIGISFRKVDYIKNIISFFENEKPDFSNLDDKEISFVEEFSLFLLNESNFSTYLISASASRFTLSPIFNFLRFVLCQV